MKIKDLINDLSARDPNLPVVLEHWYKFPGSCAKVCEEVVKYNPDGTTQKILVIRS